MRLKENLRYKVYTAWNKRTGGIADTGNFYVKFDTPKEFEGEEESPCPDQYFLASLTGCLTNTFLYYKNQLEVDTVDLKITAVAEIALMNPLGYRVTGIRFQIEVWSDEDNVEMNQTCAERARDYCHLTRSIEKSIPIRVDITVHETK